MLEYEVERIDGAEREWRGIITMESPSPRARMPERPARTEWLVRARWGLRVSLSKMRISTSKIYTPVHTKQRHGSPFNPNRPGTPNQEIHMAENHGPDIAVIDKGSQEHVNAFSIRPDGKVAQILKKEEGRKSDGVGELEKGGLVGILKEFQQRTRE